jgi:hypothetical protein
VGVYSYREGKAKLVMSTSYMKYLTCDLDADGISEMLVLKPGVTDAEYGAAALCSIANGVGSRSEEVQLSCPIDQISQIQTGLLSDGTYGVFISGTEEDAGVLTDVLTLSQGDLKNAALDSKTGTRMEPLFGFQVYPGDMNGDGAIEMPELVKARDPNGTLNQRIIRWYDLSSQGAETDCLYTYHDFENGWYLELADSWLGALRITREGNAVSFYQENLAEEKVEKIFSVYILTGQNREENAVIENRFTLHKGDNVIYAARLEVASGALSITQENLISSFRLLSQAWKSEEK